jgi:polyvinyl alcohol dehydrogenase (cytochrome)
MRRLGLVLVFTALASWPAISTAQDGAALYDAHCARCHNPDSGVRAPERSALATMTPAQIVAALEGGVMNEQGAELTPAERRAVAAFLSTAAPLASGGGASGPKACAAPASLTDASDGEWNSWGGTANRRFQAQPGFTAEQIPALQLKWAFGFENEASAAVQPSIVGNRVFVASGSGRIYALGLDDGCLDWTFKADGGVRNAPVYNGGALYFGDLTANVYRIDARTGALGWKQKIDEHRSARITGSPVFDSGRLYVPVSSIEEATSMAPNYQCCTFRGSVAALDAATGKVIWKTYTIPEEPKPSGTSSAGTPQFAPAGAAVWSAPTIDPSTNSIYIATGDAYTQPAAPTSDAVMALDMATGAVKWVQQVTKGDAYTMACNGRGGANCPDPAGPDHDFGQPPILVSRGNNLRALVLGQKSGQAHALDPDNNGELLWTVRVGKGGALGGSEWGSASDGTNLYVAISDIELGGGPGGRGANPKAGGGLHAIRVSDGSVVWSAPAPVCGDRPGCSPAQMAAISAMPGAVFSGALDGVLRAYSSVNGSVIWSFDTAKDFPTVNGVAARGGAIDVGGPAIAHGMVLTTSGNGTWGGQRGNVLLAFGAGEGR